MTCRATAPPTKAREDLARIPYFEGVPPSVLEDVERRLRRRRTAAGETLLVEGETSGRGLWLVLDGLVKVHKVSADGREQVLRLIGGGRSFNDVPAFDGGPNPATVTALRTSEIAFLPQTDLDALMQAHPVVARNATRVLAARLRALTQMIEDLAFRGVVSRVARLLWTCARGDHSLAEGDHAACVRITQAEVAAMTGSVREVVQRALKALETDGAIRLERAQITVLDAEVLEAWADAPAD